MFEFTLSRSRKHEETHTDHSSVNIGEVKHSENHNEPLPFIVSPAKNIQGDDLRFELRHESNTLELFFDLFFIANLATFTSVHSIIDLGTLVAYIGLFAIIWFTWFQITLHDVRFAVDCVYERICKAIQFVIFVGFALVGSKFDPGGKEHNNTIFQILCWLLFISRLLLVVQYSVATFFIKRKTKTLTIPMAITITTFLLCGGSFYAMTPAFSPSSGNGLGIYYVWYIILLVEISIVIGVAVIWTGLSFKKTHLMERMGLLTLIVIGEGAIGVTKTIAKLMAKSGIQFEGCFLVICIVLILFFLWMLYFDNHPKYHYGSIKQMFWAGLHFPLHLGIIGVVEGSQQLALARHIYSNLLKLQDGVIYYCVKQNQEGTVLRDNLAKVVKSFGLEDKLESKDSVGAILSDLYTITNQTGLCSPTNITAIPAGQSLPTAFNSFMGDTFSGLFEATGLNLPQDIDPEVLAPGTFLTLYVFFWASIVMIMACLAILMALTANEEHRPKLFDSLAIKGRIVGIVLGLIGAAIAASSLALHKFIASVGILPTAAAILAVVLVFDWLGRLLSRRRARDEWIEEESDGTFRGSLSQSQTVSPSQTRSPA